MRFTLPGVPSITYRCGPSSAADPASVLTESAVETSSRSEDEPTNVEVRWRPDGDEVAGSFDEFDANLLKSSVPWRVFRWRKGQRHYSGSYWSSTMARTSTRSSAGAISEALDERARVERVGWFFELGEKLR
jgi:hypothetical protein